MINPFRSAAICLALLSATVGCKDDPPVPESTQPGPTQPAPNEGEAFPGAEQSQPLGEPNTSESSSFDFDSQNTSDRYSDQEFNPSASQGPGTVTGDDAGTGDVLSGFDSTDEPFETQSSDPFSAANETDVTLSDQPDVQREASGDGSIDRSDLK